MMLSNPIKDFLKKAYPHAKQSKVKELNYLEAELIMMEEEIMNLNKKGILPGDVSFLISRIDELKKSVKTKRNALSVNVPVTRKIINVGAAKKQ